MTITLKQLGAAKAALTKVLNTDVDVQVAISLRRLAKKVEPEMETFFAKKTSLQEQYGKKDTAGKLQVDPNNNIQFEAGQDSLYQAAFAALESKEIDVPGQCIELKNLTGIKLSAFDLVALEPFLIEDKNQKPTSKPNLNWSDVLPVAPPVPVAENVGTPLVLVN